MTIGDQSRALWLSTVAFTACFAVWTVFSIIGIPVKAELGLSDGEFGLLIGTPILTGAITRVALGIWADQYGGRVVFPIVMLAAAAATFLLSFARTYPEMLVAALGVGIAGGSFAVGVAYVSRFYPAGKQGTALGIFGVGNVGAAVTKFAAPFVLIAWGWQSVALVWAGALALMAVIFWFGTEDDPVIRERRSAGTGQARSFLAEFAPLRDLRVWHRGTPNRSSRSRPHLALVYTRPWYRFEQPPFELSQATYDSLSEKARAMFRFNVIRKL